MYLSPLTRVHAARACLASPMRQAAGTHCVDLVNGVLLVHFVANEVVFRLGVPLPLKGFVFAPLPRYCKALFDSASACTYTWSLRTTLTGN